MNGIFRQSFGKHMSRVTQVRLHNFITKTALTYECGNWIQKQRNRDSKQDK